MKQKILYFTAPRRMELREETLPAPGADDVVVETICSAISAGTEMLVYRGEFPYLNDSHDNLSSDLKYPLAYGYACAGIIREAGTQADKSLIGRLAFGFKPHASAFVCHPSSLIFAPVTLPVEACPFLPSMETAVNLVQDAAPILGERALVLGQGVVGLIVASLLKEFPLDMLVTSDCYELRRNASREAGVFESFDPQDEPKSDYTKNKFDLTFELTGSPSAIDKAIALTAFSGRVVIGSWFGDKSASIDLGGWFHRSRIKLISSQVSTIAPELSGRWDKTRRFGVVWEALTRIQPQKWITHRFPIDEAERAYRLLDENPQETIQVVFDYPQ
jgi:2-desacetyl-2-hydroxyethyl bacteriochlorophyllide A dehydrogenase